MTNKQYTQSFVYFHFYFCILILKLKKKKRELFNHTPAGKATINLSVSWERGRNVIHIPFTSCNTKYTCTHTHMHGPVLSQCNEQLIIQWLVYRLW